MIGNVDEKIDESNVKILAHFGFIVQFGRN
jgi:hypothetical protein